MHIGPDLIEQTRRAFLETIKERRADFARSYKTRFLAINHESGYVQRWPEESLALVQSELRARMALLEPRLADAIDAGWQPGPFMSVGGAIQRCCVWDSDDEHPSSDLERLVRHAYEDVGRPATRDDTDLMLRRLGDVQVSIFKRISSDLEVRATKKYGDYRNVKNDDQLRMLVLRHVNEAFSAGSQDPIGSNTVIDSLGFENNEKNRATMYRVLEYWRDRGAMELIESKAIDGPRDFAYISRLTATAMHILENKATAVGSTVHNIWNIQGPVAVAANEVSGSVVSQLNNGHAGLIEALERLLVEMRESNEVAAPAIVLTAESTISAARSNAPNLDTIGRMFYALAVTVQTMAAAPPAWALVVKEAAKLGLTLTGVQPH